MTIVAAIINPTLNIFISVSILLSIYRIVYHLNNECYSVPQIYAGRDLNNELPVKYCFSIYSFPVNEAMKPGLPGILPLCVDFNFSFNTRIPTVKIVMEINIIKIYITLFSSK